MIAAARAASRAMITGNRPVSLFAVVTTAGDQAVEEATLEDVPARGPRESDSGYGLPGKPAGDQAGHVLRAIDVEVAPLGSSAPIVERPSCRARVPTGSRPPARAAAGSEIALRHSVIARYPNQESSATDALIPMASALAR
jgi:hypothetical protein